MGELLAPKPRHPLSVLWKNLLLAGAAVASFALTPAFAQLDPKDSDEVLTGDRKRETMRDLTGVEVVIEPVRPDAEQDGLSTSKLRSDVEAQLHEAGIRILSTEERRTEPGHPYLYVSITTVKTGSLYAYAIDISLNQTVTLTRHPSIQTFAPTWSVQASGLISASHLATIFEQVRGYVSKFIRDYSSINPEERALKLLTR